MQIPETPSSVLELDLMKRLDDYANGNATWANDNSALGENARQACRTLHTNLTNLVNGVFAFILDRVTAREMEMFTMHDRVHGRKVAHLMWHILKPERRDQLTPPEIAILVVAAHMHDLGMGLSPNERAERLKPDSDLWDRIESQDSVRTAIENLRTQIGGESTSEPVKRRAEQQLFQAEEALLTQDTRERHATKVRYQEILGLLADFHRKDPTKIPDIEAALSFDGDSFRDKLVDVCISHNEDADALVSNDERNLDRPRFPRDFPVGSCNADLHLVAAALRLADILDFDRERTPPVLFHYLLPTTLSGLDNRSVLEWGKHLSISNWHIERDDIVFRGRSQSHILHHAVVQFSSVIVDELKGTHATFSPLGEETWPFSLPLSLKTDIHEEGYRYVPYKFELDDERVYSLLMGGAIYKDPLVAVRELVQNAVDACKLRDSLTRLHESYEEPLKTNRIIVRYEEPSNECVQPRLTVRDTGTGMDGYTLERYFLQVGRSYYSSSDFNQFRVQLRRMNLDFAPISEFGIGFLSTFLLADHVEVETAMWESLRGDTVKRLLRIDGPTRLIRLDEQRNEGAGRFKGTRITLFLAPKIRRNQTLVPAGWIAIKDYLLAICQDLPYSLNLEYVASGTESKEIIHPVPLTVTVPKHLEAAALRIVVDDKEFGIEGEIALINPLEGAKAEKSIGGEVGQLLLKPTLEKTDPRQTSVLLRGGFAIGQPSGLPSIRFGGFMSAGARLRLTWTSRTNKRYLSPNLARDAMSNDDQISDRVLELWLRFLLDNRNTLPKGQFYNLYANFEEPDWLREYSPLDIYQLARQDWVLQLRRKRISEVRLKNWEQGKGPALWYGFHSLGHRLLSSILPKVTTLQIDKDQNTFIVAPPENWQSVLADWQDRDYSETDWGLFIEYQSEIRDFLYLEELEGLNSKYEDRFASWSDEDISSLIYLIDDRLDPDISSTLDPSDATLFRRAQETVGELKIGSLRKSFTLRDFKVRSP